MRITMRPIGLGLLCLAVAGCAYAQDRGRDFTDIVTLGAESGSYNVSLQAGMLFGIGTGRGAGVGLRSGYAGRYDYEEENLLTLSARTAYPWPILPAPLKVDLVRVMKTHQVVDGLACFAVLDAFTVPIVHQLLEIGHGCRLLFQGACMGA